MGNCWGKRVKASQTPSTTRTLSSGISNANSNEGQLSGSAGGPSSNKDGQILPGPNLRIFSYAELKSATSDFRPNTVLGEGGFGRVFKGWVDEKTLMPTQVGRGLAIAVKKLNSESVQGWEEWQSEVNFLGTLSHPNIVKLLGYCWEEKELLLVYEFVAKGSLENHLFGRSQTHVLLSWNTRLKIAIGAARGLAFLHTSEKPVIYRDFKTSNILLEMDYNAKVADFGLAKNGPVGGNSHVTTRIMGSYGYAAPEYVATGHLYVKSDVYGFGVVLLEMLTGLRALDTNRPSGQHNLVEWAKPLLSSRRRAQSLMDRRLERQYPPKGAQLAAELTLKCLGSDPRIRPSMKEVLETLERIEAIKFQAKGPKAGSVSTATHNQPVQRRHHPRPNHSPLHPHQ